MKGRKILSGIAAAAVVLNCIPMNVFAEEHQRTVCVAIANNTFSVADGAGWEGDLIDHVNVPIDDDSTMLSAITYALEAEGCTISAPDSGFGPYISDINGVGEITYAVKEGCYPGWNISLNQWYTNQGVSAYTVKDGTLKDGDFIGVEYAVTGADISNNYSSNDTSLAAVLVNGVPQEDFDPSVFEYTLELDSNELYLTGIQSNGVFQIWSYINEYTPAAANTGNRPQDKLTVNDGDVVFVGVGDPAWPSSYWGADAVTESVYKFNIEIENDEKDEDVENVEQLISAIGEVTLDSKEAIETAKNAFDALPAEKQELVSNKDYLHFAIDKYNELLEEDVEYETIALIHDRIAEVCERLSKEDAVLGNEWKAIGLSVNGKYSEAQTAKLMEGIADYASKAVDGKLNERRSTENAKEAITAAALGYDPANIGGVDLLKALAEKDYVSKQGITGFIWANIAYTSVGREAPYTKELLSYQLENGAFSYDGQTADIDTTAMVITSLRGQKEADEAVRKAFDWLADALNNGSFRSSESVSQYLIAISAAREFYDYEKLNDAPGDMLLDYYLGNGEFAHTADGKYDGMATEQALLALTAVDLARSDRALYDFTGKELKPYTVQNTDKPSDSSEASSAADNDKKGANPATAGGLAGGLLIITAAGAAICLSKRK